jgi:hypothetical protein
MLIVALSSISGGPQLFTWLLQKRDAVRGLRIVSRSPVLPHFTVRLEPL